MPRSHTVAPTFRQYLLNINIVVIATVNVDMHTTVAIKMFCFAFLSKNQKEENATSELENLALENLLFGF